MLFENPPNVLNPFDLRDGIASRFELHVAAVGCWLLGLVDVAARRVDASRRDAQHPMENINETRILHFDFGIQHFVV